MSRAPTGRMQNLFKNNRNVFEAALKKKVTPHEWARRSRQNLRWKHQSHAPPMRRIRPGMTGVSLDANRAGPYSRAP